MMLVEGRGVAVEPVLVLEPALDKVEGDLGQPPLRHAVQIFDIDGVFHSHRAGFSLKSATLAGVSGQSYRVSPRFSTIRNSAGLTCTPGHNRDLYGKLPLTPALSPQPGRGRAGVAARAKRRRLLPHLAAGSRPPPLGA